MGLVERFTFFEMTEELVAKCGEFSCHQDPDIDSFFHSKYALYYSEMIGRSYCFVDETNREIVCAFTVSHSILNRNQLSSSKQRKVQAFVNNEAKRKDYPSTLIGQLVVFDKYRDQNLGNELMDYIKGLFALPQRECSYRIDAFGFNNCGSRFLLVDATNTDKVLDYYLKNGFDFLYESVDLEIEAIAKTMSIQECNIDSVKEYHQTRLMFFDMINKYSKHL